MIKIIFLDEKMDINRVNFILEIVTTQESIVDKKFKVCQQAFAKKYGFSLTENSLQKEIDEE